MPPLIRQFLVIFGWYYAIAAIFIAFAWCHWLVGFLDTIFFLFGHYSLLLLLLRHYYAFIIAIFAIISSFHYFSPAFIIISFTLISFRLRHFIISLIICSFISLFSIIISHTLRCDITNISFSFHQLLSIGTPLSFSLSLILYQLLSPFIYQPPDDNDAYADYLHYAAITLLLGAIIIIIAFIISSFSPLTPLISCYCHY